MRILTALAAGLTLAWFQPARASDDEFIRVDEDEKAARLQTAITTFHKNGATVDLIGAIHIGDKPYYQDLNQRFKAYEVLLFEAIGGENLNAAPAPAEKADPTHLLGVIYDRTARALNLVGQVEHIDYRAANFLHADLTLREFQEKQAARGESMLGFFLSAEKSNTRPDPVRFLYGLLAKRPDLLKLSIIHTLGDAEDQIASLAGDNVIIGDRNIRCLEVLDRELAAGRKKVAIFYGAAHYPDMQKRLLEDGFTRTSHEWVTAWNVLKPLKGSAGVPPASSPHQK